MKKTFLNYALRAIALPFIATAALIGAIKLWIVMCKNFMMYGGEVVTFTKNHSPTTLADLLNFLTEKLNIEQEVQGSDT